MTPSGFRSPRTLGQVLTALLGAVLVVELAQTVSLFLQLDLLDRIARGAELAAGEADANDQRVAVLGGLYSLSFSASIIAFLVWFHRLYKNLSTFALAPLLYTPGWAVGSFFVPFLNLVRPYQIMREAWSHNAPPDKAAHAPLLGWWWGVWIASNLSANAALRFSIKPEPSLAELSTMTQVQIVDEMIGAVAAILAILVVRRQTAYQIARAEGGTVSDVFD